uniref:Uncharacterized protein n=1 Tax=Sinocyclocheilus grahami TaxID=75366 RepID=A0A672KQJ5_SINGR
MPPKRKSFNKSPKGKTPTVVDGLSTDEMSKEQVHSFIFRFINLSLTHESFVVGRAHCASARGAGQRTRGTEKV